MIHVETLKSLSDLKECECAVIKKICTCGLMKRRLQDLGLIPGTRVKCVFKNHSKSMSAYCVRGTVIALRKSDADLVEIKLFSGR